MSVWIILVVIAQFLNAIVAVVDKYIVTSKTVPRPIVYAFYITLLSAFSGVIFLFSDIPVPLEGVSIPSFENVEALTATIALVSLLAGMAFFFALVGLFSALKRAAASDVIPVVGACSAVVVFLLSSLFLGSQLTSGFLFGFVLLVIGTFLLSQFRFDRIALLLAIISGLFFAAHFVLLKSLFAQTNFDNAFFWSRMGIAAVALLMLLLPLVRKRLSLGSPRKQGKAGALVIGNKMLAGLASLMLLKAIDLGDISIVQALGGLQFAFLLSFTIFFGRDLPQVCEERCTEHELLNKTIAVGIIIFGFAVLFL